MAASKLNMSELVARMPDVDPPKKPEPKKKKEGEAQQEALKPESPPEPPPDPNRPGKFTGPDPEAAEKIFAEIITGGRDALRELIGLVHAPSEPEFQNYKAGYVLHGLVIYLGAPAREEMRRLLGETLGSALGDEKHSKAAKAFFIQELQTVGGLEAITAIGKQLLDDELNEPATRALLAIHDGAARVSPGQTHVPARVLLSILEGIAEQFRSALPKMKGRSRLNVIQALGSLRDTASLSPLEKALTDKDRDVRLAAAWALACQADASSAKALLEAADKGEGWERTQLANACLLLAEKLAADGHQKDASRIYRHLRDTRKDDSERYVREAAQRGLM